MEDDEEKAYSWIRFWCEEECKAVMDVKYEKMNKRQQREAKKAVVKTLDTLREKWDRIIAKFSSGKTLGDLEDEEAKLFAKMYPDNESGDSSDESPRPLQFARRQQVIVQGKLEKHTENIEDLEAQLSAMEPRLREAEKAKDNAWNHYRKLMKDGKTRTQLSTEHTKNYIISFVQYPGYYRELPQMRTNWIGDNLMSIWGGVRGIVVEYVCLS